MPQVELVEQISQEAGIYTWHIAADVLYGDTAVAALFGLDPSRTIAGLPLADYIAHVHPEDRDAVVGSIAEVVRNGLSYHSEYRVIDSSGKAVKVMKLGRCFFDSDGKPAYCSGIIYPVEAL